MANTYYVPNTSGWATDPAGGYIRIKVVQAYNISTNKSTLTISLQGKRSDPQAGIWDFCGNVGGRIKVGNTVIYDNNTHYPGRLAANLQSANTWYDIRLWGTSYDDPGDVKTWSHVVSHSTDGSALVTFEFYGDFVCGSSGGSFSTKTVNLDISQTRTFTLSISAGTGSSITVKKGNTTLSNGATITYGDVLTITFAASTGYTINTHKVNGTSFTSGNTHTVTGAVSVTSTATLKSFTLSISAGTGSSITVNRTSSPLGGGSTGNINNGATIYYNDVLRVTYSVSTGCTIGTHTINGSQFTSGTNHTVTAAVSIVTTATVNSYRLTVSAGAGTTVTVNRTSSPLGKAATGYIQNGATIYYNDVLNISWSADTGYQITTRTVNGVTKTSGQSYTVVSAISVVVAATVRSYSITATVDQHADVQITRTASPKAGAQTGLVTDSIVYYGDVISVQAVPSSGYGIDSLKINSIEVTNPKSMTVTSNITIVVLIKALGFIYIDSGSSIEKYKIIIDSGSVMEQYRAMIDTGSAIVPY